MRHVVSGAAAVTIRVFGVTDRPTVQRRIETWSGGLLAALGVGTVVQAATAKS